MHPLETIIDDSHHSPRIARRRSSLDNSCLAAPDTFRQIMNDDDSYGDRYKNTSRGYRSAQRRLSWNAAVSKPTTFLAGPLNSQSRPRVELDEDFHSSNHSPKGHHGKVQFGSTSDMLLTNSPPAVSDDGDGSDDDGKSDDESSLDSDCDSFCDASVLEPANREYLRRDLGASCYWGSTDTCALGDLDDDDDFDEVENVVEDMIRREGLENLVLDD